MKSEIGKKLIILVALIGPFICNSQALHLTQTLNYGKHITDIEFSKKTPYVPSVYIYKLQPKENIVYEIAAGNDEPRDTTKYVPPPPPPAEVKYALQILGMKNSFNLGPGEFCEFLSRKKIITEDEGDSIFRIYSVTTKGLHCTDSIIFPSRKMGSSTSCHTSEKGIFHLTQTLKKGDSLYINFYDSTLKKIATIREPHSESDISFIDDDKVFIVNWTKQSSILTVQKYSLSKGKLFETIVDMPAETSSWGIGTANVNDTMFLVYAQMYSERATWIYAMNYSGKNYWKHELPDYTDDVSIMNSLHKYVCSFYNVQGVSKTKFYSLSDGEYENGINMKDEIPEFAATTTWPVYLPMRATILPGGKWETSIINCYSPSDQSKSAYYLLVSNGKKTLKTKLRKNKSITSTNVIPFSSTKLAVIIDDDIYYYSIY